MKCDYCGEDFPEDELNRYGYGGQRCDVCAGLTDTCPNCKKEADWERHSHDSTLSHDYKKCSKCGEKIITQVATG